MEKKENDDLNKQQILKRLFENDNKNNKGRIYFKF